MYKNFSNVSYQNLSIGAGAGRSRAYIGGAGADIFYLEPEQEQKKKIFKFCNTDCIFFKEYVEWDPDSVKQIQDLTKGKKVLSGSGVPETEPEPLLAFSAPAPEPKLPYHFNKYFTTLMSV